MHKIENAAVADARPQPLDQPVVRDRIEVALQIGVHHEAVAGFDEAIDDPQRILGAASRPEAEARRVEPRVQNWLQHEFDRGLGDAVLDRGNPQRPHSAIPFRDLHAPDRRRTVISRPQRSRQLRQILVGVRREPFDALPINARRAAVGSDFRPSRRQRRRCVDLVHHTIPNASFDAVLQRRQHAVRPDGGFDPRPVAGFCAWFSNLH